MYQAPTQTKSGTDVEQARFQGWVRLAGLVALILIGTLAADHALRHSTVSAQLGHVLINEVEHNPPGTDAGNEWVELHNPTGTEVNLAEWTLSTTHGQTVTLTLSGTLPPGAYLVVTYMAEWLDNQDEQLLLKDSGGVLIDSTSIQSDAENDDRTWSRFPNAEATWSFRPATKGAPNGEPIPEIGWMGRNL